MGPPFENRTDAGRQLGDALRAYAGRSDVLVLGLARGGVPVAREVAKALAAPLDVFLVRKLGVPGHEELAMGAIASGGARNLNRGVIEALGIDQDTIDATAAEEQRELERREALYRGGRGALPIQGRTIALVDDGLATGSSMRAAIAAMRRGGAGRVVVAVPVAPPETCAALRDEADEVVCLQTPEPFGGVGMWYADFGQVPDAAIQDLLRRSRHSSRSVGAA